MNSKNMIIGEAPGKTEDSNGQPFSGPAGKLLDQIFSAAGMSTNDWYVTNVVKCRPYSPKGSGKENYTPKKEQQELCRPYLVQEMELLKPNWILLLGKTAVDNVLPEYKSTSMTELRGRLIEKGGVNYYIMYHPAYILHSQYDKEKEKIIKQETWSDILRLKELLKGNNNG